MKVSVYTPVRRGGPYTWGRDLVAVLNSKGYQARHVRNVRNIITGPFLDSSDVLHSSLPIFYVPRNKPLVLTLHGDYTIEKSFWKYPFRQAIKKAEVITSPSRYLKERLDLDSAIVIPNAVCSQKFRPVEHADKEQIKIVTLTKFAFRDKSEGILNILSILEDLLKDTDKKIEYTIIGGGKYLGEMMDKAAKYKAIRPRFTGFLDDPRPHLEAADIFLYYSVHDNFPISLLEAMACGLPIVANSVGGINEMIEDQRSGYVAEDDNRYADNLALLIDDVTTREKIGKRARKEVEERFDWNEISKRYIAIYKEICPTM